MESLDYWRLCDEVTIVQAALLMAGEDPSVSAAHVERWDFEKRPLGYEAAKTALTNAVKAGVIEAKIEREERWYNEVEDYVPLDGTVNIALTTLSVASIKRFLKGRGFHSDFFFPQIENNKPDYLDAEHPNYSPKLAAAIEAWVAITEAPEKTKGKTVKKSLEIWLRANAGRFGLIKDDGKSLDEAKIIVERDWAGMRTPTNGTESLCLSQQSIAELEERGELRSRKKKAPPKEDWFSPVDMEKFYVGGGSSKFRPILEEFIAKKTDELIAEGTSADEAKTTVDRYWGGMRSAHAAESLCASPKAIAELEQDGTLQRRDVSVTKEGAAPFNTASFADKVGKRSIAPNSPDLRRTGRVRAKVESPPTKDGD